MCNFADANMHEEMLFPTLQFVIEIFKNSISLFS